MIRQALELNQEVNHRLFLSAILRAQKGLSSLGMHLGRARRVVPFLRGWPWFFRKELHRE